MPSPYRHSTLSDEYSCVELGPIVGYPDWHVQSTPRSYLFPTEQAADRFARTHAHCEYNYSYVEVRYPDGTTRSFK